MPNSLINEPSPYLLQHAHNPVDWLPWGEEAFAEARRRDAPLLVSIGYATCHWCHVMERECFEDQEVAKVLNGAFVCVKVDREERPDVDSVYMTACQLLTGHGGWPLNVLLTPEREPFFAATYLPKESAFGRMGLLDLAPRVAGLWADERDKVLASAATIMQRLRQAAGEGVRARPADITEQALAAAEDGLAQAFDAPYGGFGQAPKFPSPHNLLFLLARHCRHGGAKALEMAEKTLTAMRLGGLFDHLGGGFHRYSTDRLWLLPHFEKMLYDQAMLALAYTEAHAVTGKALYAETARAIFSYVDRDLTAPSGAFYSAEDADSEGVEGKFYVFSAREVRDVLGGNAEVFLRAYNMTEEGNFEDEATGERTGANIPHLRAFGMDLAAELGLAPDALEQTLARCREALLAHREKRVRPLLDDKVLTDWNGLYIAALARAGRVFEDQDLVARAAKAAGFFLETMRSDEGRLLHRYRRTEGGEALGIEAFLDDHAFLVRGFLELYRATEDGQWLDAAQGLQAAQDALYWDTVRGGYFAWAHGAEELPVRMKEFHDAAIPSGNSVSLSNLLDLERLLADAGESGRAAGYGGQAKALERAAGEQVAAQPMAFTWLLSALCPVK